MHRLEVILLDFIGQWPPAVALPQQHDHVGPLGDLQAAPHLTQADVNRTLAASGFITDAPAQVDGLEARTTPLTKSSQLGPHFTLQGVSLGAHVIEGGTDEDSERFPGNGHSSPS